MPTRQEQRLDLQRKQQATLVWQAAEWGMRTIQSSFPSLKDTFIYEDTGEHRILMKMVCLLYNLRAHTVGINQIKKCVHETFEWRRQQQNDYDVKVFTRVKYIFNLIVLR